MPRFALVALGAACVAAGCLSLDISVPTEISIEVTSTHTTATVGQEVTFNYDASGPSLVRVVLEYGDGIADTVGTAGATSAQGHRDHTFQAAGSYVVTGFAVGVNDAASTDNVTVTISSSGS